MSKQIFRENNLKRVSSPEQMDDYIRVSNPKVWLALAAIVVLLLGACVWGIFGRIETTVDTAAVADKEGFVVCYLKESDVQLVEPGMEVRIKNDVYTISEIEKDPIKVTEDMDEYIIHVGGMKEGEWVHAAILDGSAPEGVYQAEIVVERIALMSFVTN